MKHPNLVFVFPDQMRGQAMGFLNEEPVFTPCLNRFATQALTLTGAAANYPVCSPYRGMFMTGKYPHANRVLDNCTNQSAAFGVELQTGDICWSDILNANGYSLGYIGKWHLDAPHAPYIDCSNNEGDVKWNEWCPPHRRHGFDHWYAYGTYDQHTRPLYWDTDAPREGFQYVDQWGPEHEADRAIRYLRNENGQRNPDAPFALVVSMNPPHMPYELVPERYGAPYAHLSVEQLCTRPSIPPAGTEWGDYYRTNIRNYYAMITGVDEQFGRILAAIDAAGLAEDTIVVFTSDHGNCLGIHDAISKNNHYEESMRVPFVIRWPGRIAAGARDPLLLSTPDIYPTLLDLMGFGADVPDAVQGASHADILQGKEGPRPTSQLYLWMSARHPSEGRRGVRTERCTLMWSRKGGEERVLLHDNAADPYQMTDISAERPALVAALTEEMNGWLRKTGDPWLVGP